VIWLQCAVLEDCGDALVTEVNAKSGATNDRVVKERGKVTGQGRSVTFCTEKLVRVFLHRSDYSKYEHCVGWYCCRSS
jgi:hypothetical protein